MRSRSAAVIVGTIVIVGLTLPASADTPSTPPPMAPGPRRILVGTSTSDYALAYSPGRRLFYHADGVQRGWFAFYFDGTQIVSAFSADGEMFEQHQIVSHQPATVGFSICETHGAIYLLYTDTNHSMVFLRKSRGIDAHRILFDAPGLVVDTKRSYGSTSPNMTVDERGILQVVYRSNDGDGFRIWLVSSKNDQGNAWDAPLLLSSAMEASDSGAGTSGAPAALPGRLAVIFSGSRCLYRTDIAPTFLAAGHLVDTTLSINLSVPLVATFSQHSVVDDAYAGVHDFSLAVMNDTVHLAYVRNAQNPVMVYRRWDDHTGWGPVEPVGSSNTHTTAMGVDGQGRVWVFYFNTGSRQILCRSKNQVGAFGPPRVVATVSRSYPWTTASISPLARGVGVMWVDGDRAPFQVLFTVLE